MTSPRKRVVIAGAGPGDPDLMTIKAKRAVEDADVILYDALVNETILKDAKPGCLCISVGKRRGTHSHSQDQINRVILFYSLRFNYVLRLKGGDPFVFGRGWEEISWLREKGVTAEVIPGISSAIAGPSSAGIPLTWRGVSESFWVITGTVSSGDISDDITLAAKSSATVIVLMGVSQLTQIMEQFRRYRGGCEPVAIISNATLDSQQVMRGTIESLSDKALQETIPTPALIVVGAVAARDNVAQILNYKSVKMKVAV